MEKASINSFKSELTFDKQFQIEIITKITNNFDLHFEDKIVKRKEKQNGKLSHLKCKERLNDLYERRRKK